MTDREGLWAEWGLVTDHGVWPCASRRIAVTRTQGIPGRIARRNIHVHYQHGAAQYEISEWRIVSSNELRALGVAVIA